MRIHNTGPRITSTDYWTTEHARAGLLYLSINGGAARLLVPPADTLHVLAETRAATRVALQLAGAAAVGIVYLLFEDDSAKPFFISLNILQCDRSVPLSEVGRWIPLTLYVPGDVPTEVREWRTLPAVIRRAATEIDDSRVQVDRE